MNAISSPSPGQSSSRNNAALFRGFVLGEVCFALGVTVLIMGCAVARDGMALALILVATLLCAVPAAGFAIRRAVIRSKCRSGSLPRWGFGAGLLANGAFGVLTSALILRLSGSGLAPLSWVVCACALVLLFNAVEILVGRELI